MIRRAGIFFILFVVASIGAGQDLKGHIKQLNTLFVPNPDTLIWFLDQTLENRIEFRWQKYSWMQFEAHARNRFIYGDFVENIPHYNRMLDSDPGFFDLSLLWADGRSFVGCTEFDRLWLQFRFRQGDITLGRQRINWGMDLTWNPNDIFNTFSYLNLEYPARPGTDAVNLKIYTGTLSFIEAVFQPRRDIDSSAYGVRWKSALGSTEYQWIVANMSTHYVAGGGFSGGIWHFAVRSEFSYFHSHSSGNKNGIVATLSLDRSFASTGFVQCGILYNSFGNNTVDQSFNFIEPQILSPTRLSMGKINLLAGVNGTIRTLYTPSFVVLANPVDGSAVLIPGLSFFASDNLTLAITSMLLTGKRQTEYPNIGQLIYGKIQWDF